MVWLCAAFLLLTPTKGGEENKQKEADNKARIKRLIKRLEVDDYLVRMATLNALFECGDRSILGPVRRLFATTKDTDQKFWCACIMLKLGDKTGRRFLLEAFLSGNERERYHAAAAFGRAKFADKTVRARIEELFRNDPVPYVKTAAAYALCAIGDERGEKFLLDKLKDANWLARDMTAVLCGWLKLKPAYRILKKLWQQTKDENRKLAVCFAWGMAKFGDREAMRYLVEEGCEGLTGQMAICELGAPMVPLLIGVLQNQKKPASVRRNAAALLGLIGGKAAIEPLKKALSDKVTSVACAAARALAYTMHEDAVKPLTAVASDAKTNMVLRRAAVAALAIIRHPDAVPALRSILLGGSVKQKGAVARRLRDNAAAALAKIPHHAAEKALADFLTSESPDPRLLRATLFYIRKNNRKSKTLLAAILGLLSSEDAAVKKDAADTLKKLTNLDGGDDPDRWRQLLKKHSLLH